MMKYTAHGHQGCAILFQKLCSLINITSAVYLIVSDKCISMSESNALNVVGHEETSSLHIHVKECLLCFTD